jgi:hypothetical protein
MTKIHWKVKKKKEETPVRRSNKKRWDTRYFLESPVTQKLLRYFSEKFLEPVAPIALFKCIAVVSCKLERPRVSILHVAPSRHFKSYTSNEVMRIFENEFWINARSDFTIHSLEKYKEKLKESRCLFVNDGTTLFASKSKRTKDRLVGGLSELLADEVYTYQDFNRKFSLKGKVTLIMNMTSEAYRNYKDRLLALAFSERVLTLHHALTKPEMGEWVAKQEKTKKMRFKDKITPNDIEANVKEIPHIYLRSIQHEAKEFSYLSLKGFIGCQDQIKGIVRAHASLNNRREVCEDDFALIPMIKRYLVNPFSPYEGRIVRYAAQGLSCRAICQKIGKSASYVRQVHSVEEKARIRGIIPVESTADHDALNEKDFSVEKLRGR